MRRFVWATWHRSQPLIGWLSKEGSLTSTINLEDTSRIVSDLTANLGDLASTRLAIEIMRFCLTLLPLSSFYPQELRGTIDSRIQPYRRGRKVFASLDLDERSSRREEKENERLCRLLQSRKLYVLTPNRHDQIWYSWDKRENIPSCATAKSAIKLTNPIRSREE